MLSVQKCVTVDLVFYVLQESFFCVFVERGFLVLRGQQAGRELRARSAERVSLSVRGEEIYHLHLELQAAQDFWMDVLYVPCLRTNSLQSLQRSDLLSTMDDSKSPQITFIQTTWVITSGVYLHSSGRGNSTDARGIPTLQLLGLSLIALVSVRRVSPHQAQHHSSTTERMCGSPDGGRRGRRVQQDNGRQQWMSSLATGKLLKKIDDPDIHGCPKIK